MAESAINKAINKQHASCLLSLCLGKKEIVQEMVKMKSK